MRIVPGVCVLLVLTACTARPPVAFGPGNLTPIQVQARTRALADTFGSTAAETWDRLAEDAGDPHVVARATLEKTMSVGAAWSIAAGRCDPTSVVEMVVLFSLLRRSYERPWTAQMFGAAAADEIVAAHRRFEDAAWATAAEVLTAEQREELKELLAVWIASNSEQTYVSQVRFDDLAGVRTDGGSRQASSGSLLSLFMLDPLSRLDRATHELEQSRQLAERLHYFIERWPIQIRWHMELLFLRLAASDEARRALAAVETAAAAASGAPGALGTEGERLVDLAAVRVAAERDAAISQMAQEFDRQRTSLWADLDERQGRLGELLRDVHATIEAGDRLAVNLGDTTREVQKLFPERSAAPTSGSGLAEMRELVDRTNDSVSQIGLVTADLRTLIESDGWSERTGDVATIVADVDRRTSALIDRAFTRLAAIIVIAAVMIAGAIVVSRRIPRPAASATFLSATPVAPRPGVTMIDSER